MNIVISSRARQALKADMAALIALEESQSVLNKKLASIRAHKLGLAEAAAQSDKIERALLMQLAANIDFQEKLKRAF